MEFIIVVACSERAYAIAQVIIHRYDVNIYIVRAHTKRPAIIIIYVFQGRSGILRLAVQIVAINVNCVAMILCTFDRPNVIQQQQGQQCIAIIKLETFSCNISQRHRR